MRETQTLPGKLASEISRVTRLKAEYEATDRIMKAHGFRAGNVRPAIIMMQSSIDKAIVAADSSDIEEQIKAVKDLEDYS